MKSDFFQGKRKFKSKVSRTVAFLGATVLLHYLFLESTGQQNWKSNRQINDPIPLSVRLQTLDTSPREISVVRAQNQHTGHSSMASKAAKARLPEGKNSVKALEPSEVELPVKIEPPTNLVSEDIPQIANDTQFTLRLPPSAEFDMDVSYSKANASPTHGIANLSWISTPGSYSMSLRVSVDLLLTSINLLQITSEGTIGPTGLMPTLNNDTRRSRPTTAIHFKQQEKVIVFSASNKNVTMEDGAQDALSVLIQLAAIGNSDPKQLAPGKEITIQVAEGRDASIFTFHVIGEEELSNSLSKDNNRLRTIHLVRPPRAGSYNSTLEVWLAPEHSWYPVQIRNTESSGTVTNQRVTAIRRIERLEQ